MDHLLMLPEAIYFILLLCSWVAAMFSGIAFVYGIQLKKEKPTVARWGGLFALCLLMIFLLMNGMIASAD